MKRTIVALMSDGHSGHLAGLLYPETIIQSFDPDAGGYYDEELNPTGAQKDAYESFELAWMGIRQLAGKDEIVVCDNGDYVQGAKFEEGLQVQTIDQQVQCALQAKQIVYQTNNVKQVYMTFSTPSHSYVRNGSDGKLMKALKDDYPKKKFKLSHHYLLDVAGVKIDVSHHGPSPGAREWTKGNVLRAMTKSRIWELEKAHFEVPDAFVWAHVHTPSIEPIVEWRGGIRKNWWGIITPPLSWMNHYARKATRSAPILAMGMFALEVVDGKIIYVHDFTDWYDVREKVKVK